MLASKLSKVGQGHPHGSMQKRDRLILYTMQISVMPFPEKKKKDVILRELRILFFLPDTPPL